MIIAAGFEEGGGGLLFSSGRRPNGRGKEGILFVLPEKKRETLLPLVTCVCPADGDSRLDFFFERRNHHVCVIEAS